MTPFHRIMFVALARGRARGEPRGKPRGCVDDFGDTWQRNHWVMNSIAFSYDGGNSIPQFEQLPKRALLVGVHPVDTSPELFLAQRAGAGCLFGHLQK
jgi:hypothetical protein